MSPLLKIEKLNSEYNVSEKEMYLLIMSNFDELKSFLGNIVFVKENSKLLDYDPIVEVEEKTNLIRPLDLKTLNHETKLTQISESIDELVKNYTTSVQHINEKFAFYSQIISQLENS